jgi:tetratricopeptide (TPR) repeat protein
MRLFFAKLFFITTILNMSICKAQATDTLVDVGQYKLHFKIIKGTGTPILFESGSGNDGAVWNNILEPIAKITGTTLITYDRAGLGRSEIKIESQQIEKNEIINGVQALEIGLKKLGYDDDIILVSHSFGGFYSTLFASRNPEKVKKVVFIEAAQHSFYTEAFMNNMKLSLSEELMKSLKASRIGLYYELENIDKTLDLMRKIDFPSTIPVINIEAEEPFNPLKNDEDAKRWKSSQYQFVNNQPNRESITVNGSKHYVFRDNPYLVVNAIVKAFSSTLNASQENKILVRSLDYSIEASNSLKKQELKYQHSEANLNSWGYSLVEQGELDKALEIFNLNTILYPSSWNAFDSFGEILLKANRKEEAIKMYKKSLELNPDNKKGVKILKQLLG